MFYCQNSTPIETLINDLKKELLLEKEEHMAGFLGLQMDRSSEGISTLTQIGLIDTNITVMDMQYKTHKFPPADKIPLSKYEDRDPCREEWEYHSIVGMLLYLADSTR